mgnify:CR=1 FL=1|tara:strand:+ start:1464 stop:1742 length:279 start_codon:yes stop_codon:yes gene_type:complete
MLDQLLSKDMVAKLNLNPPETGSGNLVLALATAVGAFGGMPPAPAAFNEMAKNELFQYLMLWVLIFQGGGAQDTKFTTLVTGIVIALLQVLK